MPEIKPLSKEEVLVFGANAKRGPDGRVIEQGLGSALQQTSQHLAATEKERERAFLARSIRTIDPRNVGDEPTPRAPQRRRKPAKRKPARVQASAPAPDSP